MEGVVLSCSRSPQHAPHKEFGAPSKTKACRRARSSKTTESGNLPEARRAAGPTARRSCRRANHCPLMPALALRQAHSCRPRPRPVLAPHPDAAAQNTEHATRARRGSGTRAPTGQRPKSPARRELAHPPEGAAGLGARRGSHGRQRRGQPPRTRVARAPAHTHTLFSRSRVAQRSRDSVVRADRRRCGKIQPPHRSRSRPVHTCLPARGPRLRPLRHLHRIFLSFLLFLPKIYARRPCRLVDAARAPTDLKNISGAANWPRREQ
jgi:hypothetical protein